MRDSNFEDKTHLRCRLSQIIWMDERMDGWMDGRMDEWMDGRMDGWMDGWMDEWMSRRIDTEVNSQLLAYDY